MEKKKKKDNTKRDANKSHNTNDITWQTRKELYHKRDKEEHLIPLNLHGNEIPERREVRTLVQISGIFLGRSLRGEIKNGRVFFFSFSLFMEEINAYIIPRPLTRFLRRARV